VSLEWLKLYVDRLTNPSQSKLQIPNLGFQCKCKNAIESGWLHWMSIQLEVIYCINYLKQQTISPRAVHLEHDLFLYHSNIDIDCIIVWCEPVITFSLSFLNNTASLPFVCWWPPCAGIFIVAIVIRCPFCYVWMFPFFLLPRLLLSLCKTPTLLLFFQALLGTLLCHQGLMLCPLEVKRTGP